MSAFSPARILLPSPGTDLSKWAVIACDQFTSEPEYWDGLDRWIGDSPSTLRMILPEAYLDRQGEETIASINRTMDGYLRAGILRDSGPCMILVERKTPFVDRRLGLVLSVDLEAYSYEPGSRPEIRATEQTVASRIPPRVKIRERAPLELPHVLLLINDRKEKIIETLYDRRDRLEPVYDFELNMNGGHLRGWKISDPSPVLAGFASLSGKEYSLSAYGDPEAGLLGVIGDGNHSLAAAKAHWDHLKGALSPSLRDTHPARFALVEVENIYDEGLKFEPIHRVVFHAGPDFLPGLQSLQEGDFPAFILTSRERIPLRLPRVAPLAIRKVQEYIDAYLRNHPETKVDYVHGIDHLQAVCRKDSSALGITLPPLAKEDLFPFVLKEGVLPRKSFSMGEAVEKRYYFEAHKITE